MRVCGRGVFAVAAAACVVSTELPAAAEGAPPPEPLGTPARTAGATPQTRATPPQTGVAPTGRPVTLSPMVPAFTPLLPGEPTGDKGATSYLTSMPLRLSLGHSAFAFPHAGGGVACEPREEASGNTINGFAVQRYTFLRLTPRLVLHGFSTAGCPLDAGMGGALTYAAPLSPKWWLVASGGIYAQTSAIASRPTLRTDVHIDVMKQDGGLMTAVGLGTRGFTFTGNW